MAERRRSHRPYDVPGGRVEISTAPFDSAQGADPFCQGARSATDALVIPAQAGIQCSLNPWTPAPAFAGACLAKGSMASLVKGGSMAAALQNMQNESTG